jgi:hypothetical protein
MLTKWIDFGTKHAGVLISDVFVMGLVMLMATQ